MEWSIQDIARTAGTTSRTLRHYGDIGLLAPSRVGNNGYRYYSQDSLIRLQRILLLRELGLSLPTIAEVLDGEQETVAALRIHLELLVQERERIESQIESVRITLEKTMKGEELMATEVFNGFDHTKYKDEVISRWGKGTYARGVRWWRSLTDAERQAFQQQQSGIAADYGAAHQAGKPADGEEVQAITQRQFEWLSITTTPTREYFVGLGQMYVDDPRFTASYDQQGAGTAEFVRDAMTIYAERNL